MRPLRVVGPRWMADDLGAAHDWGFDAPADDGCDFWCSGDHYGRLVASGSDISFSTPGGTLPLVGWIARSLSFWDLGELHANPPRSRVFAKPNDLKLPGLFDAEVYEPRALVAALERVMGSRSVVDASAILVSLSEPVVFGVEVRTFVLDGQVIECCAYSNGQGFWGRGLDGLIDEVSESEIVSLVEQFVSQSEMPRSLVVDVGFCDDEWEIIETNPAASSSWYSWTPGASVPEAIRAGQHDDPSFTWRDPLDHRRSLCLSRS